MVVDRRVPKTAGVGSDPADAARAPDRSVRAAHHTRAPMVPLASDVRVDVSGPS